jgi:hypothetical protein
MIVRIIYATEELSEKGNFFSFRAFVSFVEINLKLQLATLKFAIANC